MASIQLREYVDAEGRSAHAKWFASLNAVAAAKVAGALYQLAAQARWSDYRRRKR